MWFWDLRFLQVVCGRRPCLLPGTPGRELHSCPGGRECMEHNFLTCLSPPCHQWGFCSSPEAPPTIQTKCEPNTVYLDKSCARITLIFNRDKLPTVSILVRLTPSAKLLFGYKKARWWWCHGTAMVSDGHTIVLQALASVPPVHVFVLKTMAPCQKNRVL